MYYVTTFNDFNKDESNYYTGLQTVLIFACFVFVIITTNFISIHFIERTRNIEDLCMYIEIPKGIHRQAQFSKSTPT